MKGIMYFKKWKHMPWFSRLYHIKNQSYNAKLDKKCKEVYHLCLMAYQDTKDAIEEHKKQYFKKTDFNCDEPLSTKDHDKLNYFINVFFKKYPQMCEITWGSTDTFTEDQNVQFYKIVNGLYRKYLSLLKNGYKKDVATEKVLKHFEDKIMLKLEEIGITENLAESQRGVSVMNYLLHQSLQESNNKMLRIQRDDSIQNLLENQDNLQDNHFFTKIQNFRELDPENPKKYLNKNFSNFNKRFEEFKTSYDYLFNMYYNDAFQRDNLMNLESYQVLRQLRNLPSLLEKEFKPLIQQLTKHNIILSQDGEVDYSGCKDKNVLKKFKKNYTVVKYALQLNDLNFGYVHRQNLQDKYFQIKNSIKEFNQDARNQIEQQQKDYIEKMKQLRKLDQSKLDKNLDFKYFEIQDFNEENFEENMKKMNMNFNQFLNGISPRVDRYNLQSLDQNSKNLLVEAEWTKMKIKRLDLIENEENQQLFNLYKHKLVNINESLRNLKLITDSKLNQKTQNVFFDEHRGIDMSTDVQNLDSLKDFKEIEPEIEKNKYPAYRNIDKILNYSYLEKDLEEHDKVNLTSQDSQDHFWNKQANDLIAQYEGLKDFLEIEQYQLEKGLLTNESRAQYEQDILKANESFRNHLDKKEQKVIMAKQQIEEIQQKKMQKKLERQLDKKLSRKEKRAKKNKK